MIYLLLKQFATGYKYKCGHSDWIILAKMAANKKIKMNNHVFVNKPSQTSVPTRDGWIDSMNCGCKFVNKEKWSGDVHFPFKKIHMQNMPWRIRSDSLHIRYVT